MTDATVERAKSACCLVCLLLALALPGLHGQSGQYSNRFDKTCRYAASNITAALFLNGTGGGGYLMPLDSTVVAIKYSKPWRACFGPGEQVNMQLMQSGLKLPCFYQVNEWGNIDYWEENACDILLRTNCYCYSIGHYLGSYCEPGLGSTGKAFPLPVKDCKSSLQGVIDDGGQLVDRWTVYNKPPTGKKDEYHYIALAVKPSTGASDTGDFHFWRYDHLNASWSYKAGDSLSRNTYRNGTLIHDVEAPAARGGYTSFCGYFKVWPDTHKLQGNGYYFSNMPARLQQWRQIGLNVQVATLSAISPGWLAAYKSHYAVAGWEDSVPQQRQQHESSRAAGTPLVSWLHTYSAKPLPRPA